jgi:hypothetical protein
MHILFLTTYKKIKVFQVLANFKLFLVPVKYHQTTSIYDKFMVVSNICKTQLMYGLGGLNLTYVRVWSSCYKQTKWTLNMWFIWTSLKWVLHKCAVSLISHDLGNLPEYWTRFQLKLWALCLLCNMAVKHMKLTVKREMEWVLLGYLSHSSLGFPHTKNLTVYIILHLYWT